MCLELGAVTILHPRFENLEAHQQLSREYVREKFEYLGGNARNAEQAGVLVHIKRHPTNRVRLQETSPQVMDEPQRCSD